MGSPRIAYPPEETLLGVALLSAVLLRSSGYFGTSSNGKTADSGSAYRGSNPCVPANLGLYASSRCIPLLNFDGAEHRVVRVGDHVDVQRAVHDVNLEGAVDCLVFPGEGQKVEVRQHEVAVQK